MAGIKQISSTPTKQLNKSKKPRKARVKNQDRALLTHIEGVLCYSKPWTTSGVFYPSMLGNKCDRYLYLAYQGNLPTQTITAKTARIFDNGSQLEVRMKKYFERMGVFIAAEQSVKLANPNISGRYDFLLSHVTHGRILLELKSINTKGFEALIEAPKPEHAIQLQIYLNLAGIDNGVVLYENKNDQELKAFKVDKDTKVWDNIIERCIKIQNMLPLDAPNICTGDYFCACKEVK